MFVEREEEDGEHGDGKAEWMRTMHCVWRWNGTCKIKAQRYRLALLISIHLAFDPELHCRSKNSIP